MVKFHIRYRELRYYGESGRFFTLLVQRPEPPYWEIPGNEYRYPRIENHQYDPVLPVILITLKKLTKTDIAVSAAEIYVASLTSAPPLWPPSPTSSEVKLYTFKESNEEFPFTAPLRLVPGHGPGPLTADMIEVRSRSEWKPLKTWLLEFSGRNMKKGSRLWGPRGLYSQQRWWDKNGKHFPLMKLPKELRLILLKHILGENIYPDTAPYRMEGNQLALRVVLGNGYDPDRYELCKDQYGDTKRPCELGSGVHVYCRGPMPNRNIFLVNRIVREEALRAGWVGTYKIFTDPGRLVSVNSCQNSPGNFNWLAKIELDCTTWQYFRLFGVSLADWGHQRPQNEPHCLQIAMLTTLRLRFQRPDEKENLDPWGMSSPSYPIDPLDRSRRNQGCQKIITDWILTFGFRYIKHIPTVTFAGFIKTSTARKWEAILACEQMRQRHGGLHTQGFDWEAAINDIIEDHPFNSLPPRCQCPKSCGVPSEFVEEHDHYYTLEDGGIYEEFDFDDAWTVELAAVGYRDRRRRRGRGRSHQGG